MKQKKKEPAPKSHPHKAHIQLPEKRILVGTGVFSLVFVLVRCAATFFPDARLWGLNYLAFLPWQYPVILFTASLLFCTPLFYRAYIALAELLFGNHKRAFLYGVLLTAVAGVFFWIFRMETYFLGDGASYLAEQYRFIHNASISTDVLFGGKSAPLTGTVLAYTARAINDWPVLKALSFPGPHFTFWFFAVVSGIVYVAGCLHAARTLFQDAGDRFGTFILLLFTPGVLFFFGYVEYYTFYFTCIFFYFFLLVRSLEGKVSVVVPASVLVLATAFHLMSAVALPSLVFLFLQRSQNERLRRFVQLRYVLFFIGVVLVTGAVVYFASGIYANGNRNIMSLFPYHVGRRIQHYTLLSSYHLVDFLNLLFLIAAPLCIGIAFLLTRKAFHHPETLLAFINLCFFACLAFFGNAGFGLARDWDINAALGLAVIFFVIALARHSINKALRNYLFYIMCGAALTAGGGWFVSNINTPSSVARFSAIMELDAKHIPGDAALVGYEHLRKYYFTAIRNNDGFLRAIRKKAECGGYPRDYREYSQFLMKGIPSKQRREHFDWMCSDLVSKVDSLRTFTDDSLASSQRTAYMELLLESVIDCRSLPEGDGLGESYAQKLINAVDERFPANPVVGFLREQLHSNAASSVHHDMYSLQRAAGAVQSSAKLLSLIGIEMMRIDKYENAAQVFAQAYRVDSSDINSLVYFAASEFQCEPRNVEKIRLSLDTYFGDPKLQDAAHMTANDKEIRRIAENLYRYVGH